jgi:hypothetical protein
VGDFDHDGDMDVASAQREAGRISVFENRSCVDVLFRRSDSNGDGRFNVADAVYTLEYLFLGGETPGCLASADANGDGRLNVGDAVYLLEYLFLSKPPPPAPFVTCGPDPSTAPLGCVRYPPCAAP